MIIYPRLKSRQTEECEDLGGTRWRVLWKRGKKVSGNQWSFRALEAAEEEEGGKEKEKEKEKEKKEEEEEEAAAEEEKEEKEEEEWMNEWVSCGAIALPTNDEDVIGYHSSEDRNSVYDLS